MCCIPGGMDLLLFVLLVWFRLLKSRYGEWSTARKHWCKDSVLVPTVYSIYMTHYNGSYPSECVKA